MRRSGVRIPLAPPQADIRSGCRFFVCQAWCCGAWLLCCLWRRWCSGGRTCCPVGRAAGCARGRRPARGHWAGLLVAPRVFRAPEGPAAREARASLRSAPRLEARPCPPVPPAPSTPVGPGRCSAALRVGSLSGQALPLPAGTAARPRRPCIRPSRTSLLGVHGMSHAIPPRLVRAMKS